MASALVKDSNAIQKLSIRIDDLDTKKSTISQQAPYAAAGMASTKST